MDAIRQFYAEHKDQLFGYLIKMSGDYELARDLMQESFTRYIEHYGRKEPNRTLLYTIARNCLFDHQRKHGRDVPLNGEEDRSEDGERAAMIRDEYRRVLAAMDRLAGDEREILILAATDSLAYREIASNMNISEANVKVKVHRARTNLKAILAQGEK